MRNAFGGGNYSGGQGGNSPDFNFGNFKRKNVIIIAIILIALIGSFRSFAIIDSKERGILKYLGKLSEVVLEPGVRLTIPFISTIHTIEIVTKKLAINDIKIYTSDQQTAAVDVVLNYNIAPNKVTDLYKKLGNLNKALLEDTIIYPILKSTITNELGKWTAEQVIIDKEKIAGNIYTQLSKQVSEDGIVNFSNFEIISIDLDNDYEAATRAKVIAEQNAQMAKNKTRQIEEEAKQKIIQSDAEAKSMRIRSDALSHNKSLVEYEAVQKWDGHLPQYMMGNSVPFINLTH